MIKRRYGDAIDHFTRALNIDGSFAMAYLRRGAARSARVDTDGAESDRQAAFRIDPDLRSVVDTPGGQGLENHFSLIDLPFS